ncbi:MAG TPA: hypothetical protein VHI13_08385 [Candidatus Kapabacteria bacterium]|nr:hypothetical protein [Candidatus Kapabacteria bacterium]
MAIDAVDADLAAECGPASASANGIQGDWFYTRDEAAADALATARRLAAAQCGGSCTDVKQSCKYKEAKSSVDGIEEGKDANGRVIYRAKASSSGSCACA